MDGWMSVIRELSGQESSSENTEEESDSSELEVVEEASGNFHYHVSKNGEVLCGDSVTIMKTSINFDGWGKSPPHINMSWCEKCENRADF